MGPDLARQLEVHRAHARLVERFDPLRAEGVDATLLVDLADAGPTSVRLRAGRCTIRTGDRPARPTVTYRTDAAVWLDLVEGRIRGMDAFLAGVLKVTGDLHLATRFETLFRRLPGQPRVEVTHTRVRGLVLEALVAGEGTGPPVLLLHGLGANKVSFLPTLSTLAARAEVHALDLPGFGGSSAPLPAGRRYSMAWFADVVNGYLIARGLDAAHLIGNSMGGRIALEVALRHPRSTHSIVGLGPAVGFDLTRLLAPALRYTRPQWGGLAPVPLRRAVVERLVRDLFAEPDVLPPEHHRAAADDVLAAWQRPGYRLALLAAARQLGLERGRGPTAYWRRLRALEVPSLWVFGEEDRLVASRYAARVAAAVPHAEVQTWPAVGHVPQFEAPRRVAALLEDWLDRTSPPDRRPQAAEVVPAASQAVTAAT
ncbi:MAG: alpha/beta fold hydrolase [Nitriliruptoraceae bacterium]